MPDKFYSQVYRIPDSALYGADSLFVIRDGRLAARTIEVVGYAGDDLLFKSAQIKDGDQIVTTQIREGGEGVKVEIR